MTLVYERSVDEWVTVLSPIEILCRIPRRYQIRVQTYLWSALSDRKGSLWCQVSTKRPTSFISSSECVVKKQFKSDAC